MTSRNMLFDLLLIWAAARLSRTLGPIYNILGRRLGRSRGTKKSNRGHNGARSQPDSKKKPRTFRVPALRPKFDRISCLSSSLLLHADDVQLTTQYAEKGWRGSKIEKLCFDGANASGSRVKPSQTYQKSKRNVHYTHTCFYGSGDDDDTHITEKALAT